MQGKLTIQLQHDSDGGLMDEVEPDSQAINFFRVYRWLLRQHPRFVQSFPEYAGYWQPYQKALDSRAGSSQAGTSKDFYD